METGRILALDIGTKRTGVAVCDETRLIASPLTTIESTDRKRWAEEIGELARTEEAVAIVVGLPLNHRGEEGADAQRIRKYVSLLTNRVALPVIEWDERFTTVQAERSLLEADLSRRKRKEVVDKVVAAILLQSYLDSLRFASDAELSF